MPTKTTHKRTLDIPKEITDALSVPPVDYLRKWWLANSTAEERTAAEDRDATIEGAYAFIENFAQRAEEKNGACLPDQIVYDLCGIFMRICVDGDVYATAEEIAKEEAEEKERAERELKRKIDAEKKRIDAEAKEAARRAALTPEQREAEDREKAERAAKDAEEKAKAEAESKEREAAEKIKAEKRKAAARRKALAAEMEKRQMTFF